MEAAGPPELQLGEKPVSHWYRYEKQTNSHFIINIWSYLVTKKPRKSQICEEANTRVTVETLPVDTGLSPDYTAGRVQRDKNGRPSPDTSRGSAFSLLV